MSDGDATLLRRDGVAEAEGNLSKLGARLRRVRKRRQFSLADLSALSGVSVAMLSHIERGRATPSLKALEKMRSALGVSMIELFPHCDVEANAPSPIVMRAGERPTLAFETIGLVKERLSPGESSGLEVLLLIIEPGGGSGPEPWTRTGEKAGVVLEGAARLEVDGIGHDLAVGDSFQFDSSLPHRFQCLGDRQARILWIIKSDPIAKAVDA